MDTTGPERNTLAKLILEFVQQLRLSTFVSGLPVRTGILSLLTLKLPPSTRNTTNLRSQCSFNPIPSGYGV